MNDKQQSICSILLSIFLILVLLNKPLIGDMIMIAIISVIGIIHLVLLYKEIKKESY